MKTNLFFAGILLLAGGCLQWEYGDDFPGKRVIKEAEIIYYGAPEVTGIQPQTYPDRRQTGSLFFNEGLS